MKVSPEIRAARPRAPSPMPHGRPAWRILVLLGMVSLAILLAGSAGYAQEDDAWDEPFPEPLYLVHITETGTMDGPRERDDYILYPQAPDDGVLLTADGYGGYFINKAELAGGPFRNRREVCSAAAGIPEEKLAIGFGCSAMTGDGSCTADCQQMQGPNAEGTIIDGKCSCSCRDGYEPDNSLMCIPTKANCDLSCQEYHGTDKTHGPEAYGRVEDGICNCYCQKGYVPDETLTCVKEKTCQEVCEGQLGQNVEGKGQFPNCQCECKQGYDRSASTSSCLESCAAQCKLKYGWQASGSGDPAQPCNCFCLYPWHWNETKSACIERQRWVDTAAELEAFLRARGYTETHCPPGGNPPAGSVKIWDLSGGLGAHSSIVLSKNRQIDMGNSRDTQGTLIADIHLPTATNPQGDPAANVGSYQLQKVLCPPPNTYFSEAQAEKLAGTPRYGEKKGAEDDWNCHGFSANLVRNFVETFVRVRPDTNVNWDQMLKIGAIHGLAPTTVRTPQGTWHFKSEFAIEVEADGTTAVHLIEGQADYEGSGQAVSLSSGEMATISPDGVPSSPARFSSKKMDAWWEDLEPAQSAGLLTGWRGITAGLIGLGLLATAALFLVRHRARRRRPVPQVEPAQRPQPAPTRAADPWGTLSVVRGDAWPPVLNLDRPVVTLGRSASSDLNISDAMVSQRHAQVRREGNAAMLYDMGSTNGTLVNGRRVTDPCPLRPGDVITLGRTDVVWEPAAHDGSRDGQGRLTVVSGRSEPPELELNRFSTVSIGRSKENDIVVTGDAFASRRHAEVRAAPRGWEIIDVGSTHGVFVNGQRISRASLRSGDRIRLSRTEFVYED